MKITDMSYIQAEMNFSGIELRDVGMQKAIDHANDKAEKWSERAYQLLIKFLHTRKRFMGEDLRSYAAEVDFDLSPHARAWGGIIQRAAKELIIIKIGIGPVKNPKAHLANAAIWERNDERMIENGLM